MARRWVVLVRDAAPRTRGGERNKFFFGELYPRLLGRPFQTGCPEPIEEMVDCLRALGMTPEVTAIRYRSDQPFDDLEEGCGFWEVYLGLAPGAHRPLPPGTSWRERTAGPRRRRLARPLRQAPLVIAWRVDP